MSSSILAVGDYLMKDYLERWDVPRRRGRRCPAIAPENVDELQKPGGCRRVW